MVTESDLYALEQKVRKLEEKIEKLVGLGDTIEVEQHLYGDMYKIKKLAVKDIVKGKKDEMLATAYYPIFFTPKITMQHDILVYIPDFNIYTEGDSIDDAIKMAKDAIANTLIETKEFVKPSDVAQAYQKAIEDADNIYDFSKDCILTFVKVNVSDYVEKRVINDTI